jgi:hypothetical protein
MEIRERIAGHRRSTGRNASAEVPYLIRGTTDRDSAEAALLTFAPSMYALPADDGRILTREGVSNIEEVFEGSGVWFGDIRYSARGSSNVLDQANDSRFRFSTRADTHHIEISKAQRVEKYSVEPIDFKKTIGNNRNGQIVGTDILVPTYSFSEKYIFTPDEVDNAFRGTIFRATATTNTADFKGLLAGECLFAGATGERRGDGNWEIEFDFLGSPNRTDLAVGDFTGITKGGWEYLWITTVPADAGNHNGLYNKVVQVNVERVYDPSNFALLKIGT